MKRILRALLAVLAMFVGAHNGLAQGTAFTYQGRLNDGTNPANGLYYMNFRLFSDVNGANPVSIPSPTAQVLSNGLFTVPLDFGTGIFTGADRWLQISVTTNASGPYTSLVPLQKLTPAPYAITAENLNGTLPSAGLSGAYSGALTLNNAANQFTGNGSGLTGVNAATVGGLAAANLWNITGNGGTSPGPNFLGTLDNNALELHVFGARGWRLEPTATVPNIVGGYFGNVVDSGAQGATIGGGGTVSFVNQVSATLGTVAGGSGNVIQSGANDSTISGGRQNQISAGGRHSTIGGGTGNVIQTNASDSTIAGGNANTAGTGAAIPGGFHNIATGIGSFAAGGNAQATHNGDFVWCDGTQILTDSGPNRFEVLASGGAYFHNFLNVAGPVTVAGEVSGDGGSGGIFSDNTGIYGVASGPTANGVWGDSPDGNGVFGNSTSGYGAHGASFSGGGVFGESSSGDGIYGHSSSGRGVVGQSDTGLAGAFLGDVNIIAGKLYVDKEASVCSLNIHGGCDVAEPFEMSSGEIPKGSVVVIDDANPGRLKVSDCAYDHRVAGIVSGANGISTGISLRQVGALDGGQNVALSGRVYVLADATGSPIRPGDLLTTSTTPGNAMRVTDQGKALGAILGKAMSGLKEGRGMVLVLVTLQ